MTSVRFGACVLDRERRELRRRGEVVHLSPKAYELLLALLEKRPHPVSKAELQACLWPATFVHEANLANVVSELRVALGDHARRPLFVSTVHTFGYAFSGAVTEGEPEKDAREVHPFLYRLQGEAGSVTLVEGDHVLGRGHDSAIPLAAPTVSRRHARLRIERGEAVLEDLGSRHGTFVRGERLRGPQRLEDGDELSLGSVRLTFRILHATDPSGTR
jgi:DNA-binding winged helix-turn-helix (wHTH) protein